MRSYLKPLVSLQSARTENPRVGGSHGGLAHP